MPVSNHRRATLAAAVLVGALLVASMSAYTVKSGRHAVRDRRRSRRLDRRSCGRQ